MKAAQSGRGPTSPSGRSYPKRKCGYCSEEISQFTDESKTVMYFRSQYQDLATCGARECQALAHTNNIHPEQQAEADSAMDRFLRGGL